MSVLFQADADLNHIIVKATLRREPSIDFQTAHAAALVGVPDADVLALAARAGRVLVTHDRKTMPAHFAEFALDRYWVTTHLGQLLGGFLIAAGFVSLARRLRAGQAGAWALLAGLSTVANTSWAPPR